MNPFKHPLWQVGFRPFFTLACLSGMILPLTWVLVLHGASSNNAQFSSVQWHAHEMFFGFGWAVMGGFLLTASKNWLNIRGYHGAALAWLSACWLIERVAMSSLGNQLPPVLLTLACNLFLGSIVVFLLWSFIHYRERDQYRDNAIFLVLLPAFLIAKYLLLGNTPSSGYSMSLALYRVAFLVMLERTVTQFMRASFQIALYRSPWLDSGIKIGGLLLVGEFWLPAPLTVTIELLLASLLLGRFAMWHPRMALRKIELGIMYLGQLALISQLIIAAYASLTPLPLVGSVITHLFTFGVMGTIIPAMILRISQGHTGRKITFCQVDRGILWLTLINLNLRVVIPQFFPATYLLCRDLSAGGWIIVFSWLTWRCLPMLWQARIDGREH